MGANNFISLATINAGSGTGPQAAVDLWTLVPNNGLDSGFTVICIGDFSGTIAIEGSLDGTNYAPVGVTPDGALAGGFTLGNPSNSITPEDKFDLTPLVVTDTVRYVRARVAPGCSVRGPVNITLGGSQNCVCNGASGSSSALQSFHYQFFARDFYTPTNSDWALNAGASLVPDTVNPALLVRRFGQPQAEGLGWMLRIEPSMTRFSMLINSRPQSAPTVANQHVHPLLYQREIANGVPVGAWVLRDPDTYPPQQRIDFAVSAINFQTDTFAWNMGVSGPTLSAGTLYQFELVRETGACLASDWDVLEIHIETS